MCAALLGYLFVRLVGVAMLAVYGARRHVDVVRRLGSLWDAGWYARILVDGYGPADRLHGLRVIPYSRRAFFPLLPWLGAAVHDLSPLGPGTAMVVVSSLSGIAAAWGSYALARLLYGHQVGVVTAMLWGMLPLAVLENTAYTEALFTALCVWTLYAVQTGRWLLAGVLCLSAGLVRPSALALVSAVWLAATLRLWALTRERPVRVVRWSAPLAAAALAPLGWLGFVTYVAYADHAWDAYFTIQRAWGSSFDGGLGTLHWYGRFFLSGADRPLPYAVAAFSTLVYLLLFFVSVMHRQPPALLMFSGALLVLDLGNASPFPPLARFLMPAIPLLLPPAVGLVRLRSRSTRYGVLAFGVALSGVYGIHVAFLAGAPL
ncbi:hypothetical protein ABH931_007026 [Streptacidiphilus sp. MAP12-33]|uniref:hypothetical protein n=1 Tax=Streptacidiphilus sp. MAP12-33 TaxID=3156266 RepID=UPI003518BAB8